MRKLKNNTIVIGFKADAVEMERGDYNRLSLKIRAFEVRDAVGEHARSIGQSDEAWRHENLKAAKLMADSMVHGPAMATTAYYLDAPCGDQTIEISWQGNKYADALNGGYDPNPNAMRDWYGPHFEYTPFSTNGFAFMKKVMSKLKDLYIGHGTDPADVIEALIKGGAVPYLYGSESHLHFPDYDFSIEKWREAHSPKPSQENTDETEEPACDSQVVA